MRHFCCYRLLLFLLLWYYLSYRLKELKLSDILALSCLFGTGKPGIISASESIDFVLKKYYLNICQCYPQLDEILGETSGKMIDNAQGGDMMRSGDF